LRVSGLGSSNFSMETAEFGPGDVIRLAAGDASEAVAQYHSVLSCSIDSSLPEKVVGDPHRVRQIVTNLLIAAARLTPASEVKLVIFCGSGRNTELELVVEVSASTEHQDPGGADVPTSESGVYSAESLLPASRKLVQLLGGEMGVQMRPGSSPVFWCRIPVEHLTSAVRNPAPACAAPSGSDLPNSDEPAAVHGKQQAKILMAEDNVINQRVGKLILRRAGYEIELVSDGNEAVEAHLGAPYDLILMDCQMPTMDGFEATRRIRSLKTQQPVIIAVTANALVGERERCLEAGMNDYLSKPFQADQLVSMVNKWVQTCSRA
jgi:CheY-like chemotaxis protein